MWNHTSSPMIREFGGFEELVWNPNMTVQILEMEGMLK